MVIRPTAKIWLGRNDQIDISATVIAVDYVVRRSLFAFQKRFSNERRPFSKTVCQRAENRCADRERIQPERLDLHRFSDPRRDFAPVHSRVHPRELMAVFAGAEQSVFIGANAEPCAGLIAGKIASTAARNFSV